LAEKEVQLQEARVTTTQHMNSHEDTKRDRHNVANNLVKTQHDLENENAARASLEGTVQSLRDKLNFDAEVHQKVSPGHWTLTFKLTFFKLFEWPDDTRSLINLLRFGWLLKQLMETKVEKVETYWLVE
jgi:hypothetical protein